ncbi:hypothetical protein DVH24_038255 [Malus domestica]|uniref:Uncharacterized protein n=1 Tax=Malus domestica TaxID=3750 RepID=A0A498K8X7_MALDO|nr:hypothetical protein DVH24_038255 [Malus domestica]
MMSCQDYILSVLNGMLKNAQVHDIEGGRVWNVREKKGEGGLRLRAQLESSVSAAAATTLPQRGKNRISSLNGKALLTGEADLQSEVAMAACLPPPLCWVCVFLVLQSRITMAVPLLKEMYIHDELLKHDLDGKPSVDVPSCPVLVFVDIKDEKLGGRLYNEFCYRLNKKQVFAVLEDSDSKRPIKIEDPEGVLKEVYGILRKSEKYEFADDIHKRMRIIVTY